MASTFSEMILGQADDAGQIYWHRARAVALQHGLWEDFRTDYGSTASFGGVDAGEFLVWLGY
jgi:hypothetical protein